MILRGRSGGLKFRGWHSALLEVCKFSNITRHPQVSRLAPTTSSLSLTLQITAYKFSALTEATSVSSERTEPVTESLIVWQASPLTESGSSSSPIATIIGFKFLIQPVK